MVLILLRGFTITMFSQMNGSYSCSSYFKFYMLVAQISSIKRPPSLLRSSSSPSLASLTISINRFNIQSLDLFQSPAPLLFKMQVKVFLSYILATILAVGVIATPVDVEDTPPADANTLIENEGNSASFAGAPDPRPTEPVITPKEGDVLAASTSVVARDLESLEKRTPGCVFVTTNPIFRGIPLYTCRIPNGRCANLTNFWRRNISSFRPDPYTECRLFTGPNCSGTRSVVIHYPGYGLLGIFDNNSASLKCWW